MKLLLILVISFLSACAAKPVTLNGEMFVATKGAGSYKLGSIRVIAISDKDFRKQVVANDNTISIVRNQIQERLKECPYQQAGPTQEQLQQAVNALDTESFKKWQSQTQCSLDVELFRKEGAYIAYTFKPTTETVTNADGKFTLTLPANDTYIILAQASRTVASDSDEEYDWMESVRITATDKDLVLTNSNIKTPELILAGLHP